MRKRTAPRTPKRPLRSTRQEDTGLIAREKKSSRSAGSGSALDDRSHSTIALIERPADELRGVRRQPRNPGVQYIAWLPPWFAPRQLHWLVSRLLGTDRVHR